ncbi:MAG: inorganic diphosphatase [Candidatus Moranbacteria bacterium RIFCSPHIGHO2_12_FULL_54_9]|nr:MAG: inorganic diphosphatase [Candidatus Moranbacteria bacterium RIFCSPHIGHO2_01_FULL_54_31]OGI24848.1 MAG: inorganic diphosphatase [Candidatus Moranbacteria bacterium RIFCSPHIGHO2_12_FULL_54_9]
MNLWHEISAGDDVPNIINVIIECPKGSKNKYEIDKETGLIKLDRAMKTSQDYPFDYGFVPQSLWEDGDALDVVLLATYPLAPGILVEARPVGLMTMIDCGDSDDKIIAVPKSDPRFDEVLNLSDVNKHLLKEMRHFFETYKSIDGKKVVVKGFKQKAGAIVAIKKGLKMYQEKYGKRASA